MLLAIVAAGVVFYEAFAALKALSNVAAMRATMSGSLAVVRSTTMTDEDKAAAMQRSSLEMAMAVGMTVAKIFAALAVSTLFLYFVSLFFWPFGDLIDYAVRPLPLALTIVAIIIYGMLRHGRRR